MKRGFRGFSQPKKSICCNLKLGHREDRCDAGIFFILALPFVVLFSFLSCVFLVTSNAFYFQFSKQNIRCLFCKPYTVMTSYLILRWNRRKVRSKLFFCLKIQEQAKTHVLIAFILTPWSQSYKTSSTILFHSALHEFVSLQLVYSK